MGGEVDERAETLALQIASVEDDHRVVGEAPAATIAVGRRPGGDIELRLLSGLPGGDHRQRGLLLELVPVLVRNPAPKAHKIRARVGVGGADEHLGLLEIRHVSDHLADRSGVLVAHPWEVDDRHHKADALGLDRHRPDVDPVVNALRRAAGIRGPVGAHVDVLLVYLGRRRRDVDDVKADLKALNPAARGGRRRPARARRLPARSRRCRRRRRRARRGAARGGALAVPPARLGRRRRRLARRRRGAALRVRRAPVGRGAARAPVIATGEREGQAETADEERSEAKRGVHRHWGSEAKCAHMHAFAVVARSNTLRLGP